VQRHARGEYFSEKTFAALPQYIFETGEIQQRRIFGKAGARTLSRARDFWCHPNLFLGKIPKAFPF